MSWFRGLAAAALVLCIALPDTASAASAKKHYPQPPTQVNSRQLRGTMITPNWSTQDSLFTITPEQQRDEIEPLPRWGAT